MRTNPKVRALCQRVRRPTIRLLVGLGFIAPASAFAFFQAEPEIADAFADAFTVSADPIAEAQAREAVATAWRQGLIDRDRRSLSAKFAERYRISSDLADDIYWAAQKEQIDPQLAFRLVLAESSFKPRAVSPVGAVGLTQVMPSTASWLFPGTRRDELLEPRFNLRVGFRYLRRLLDTYDDQHLALLAYNRGPGRVDSLLDAGEDPGNGYPELVLTGDGTKHAAFVNSTRAAQSQPILPADVEASLTTESGSAATVEAPDLRLSVRQDKRRTRS